MKRAMAGVDSADASHAAVALANRRSDATLFVSSTEGGAEDALHYVSAGSGPTIVFVHGFPSFWYCWIRQLTELSRHFRVIAIDAPGAGASYRSADIADYRVPLLAQRLARFITAVSPDAPVLLVGHDWGAALSFALAQARPYLLAGVCGIAAPPYNQFLELFSVDSEQRSRSDYMTALREMTHQQASTAAPRIGPDAYGQLLARKEIDTEEADLFDQACGDPAALWAGAAWYGANAPDPDAASSALSWPADNLPLQLPALLIWGEADRTFVPRAPDRFTIENPGSQVLKLDGVGHWCMLQAPGAVNSALDSFAQTSFARQLGGNLP